MIKFLKQLPNHSEKVVKFHKKVAETAEIPKTAPLTQRNRMAYYPSFIYIKPYFFLIFP